jgi:antitoxin component of MazEF toxin-antitoxin module
VFVSTLRRVGNSAVVTVPRDEMERLGLEEGQTVTVEVRPAAVHVEPLIAADLQPSLERVKARPGLRKALRILGS